MGISVKPKRRAGASPNRSSVQILGVEIVQVVQNLSNEVPLIRGKPTVVRVYIRDDVHSNEWALLAAVRCKADGVEAVAWESDDLILASEDRALYRIEAARWRAQSQRSRSD